MTVLAQDAPWIRGTKSVHSAPGKWQNTWRNGILEPRTNTFDLDYSNVATKLMIHTFQGWSVRVVSDRRDQHDKDITILTITILSTSNLFMKLPTPRN